MSKLSILRYVLMLGLLTSPIVVANSTEICPRLLSTAELKHENKKSAEASHYLARPSAWGSYFDNTANDDIPRKSLVIALQYFKDNGIKSGYAVDVGAGTGRDTLYLLSQGWQVLAADFSPKAINIIKQRAKDAQLPTPATEVNDFVHMRLPKQVDLINSYLALPFAKPEQFMGIWDKLMISHLRPGGLFAGSLLGQQDEFIGIPTITTLSEQQIKCLFWPYEIIYLQHVQTNLPNKGRQKYWDIWEFVIRKPL